MTHGFSSLFHLFPTYWHNHSLPSAPSPAAANTLMQVFQTIVRNRDLFYPSR